MHAVSGPLANHDGDSASASSSVRDAAKAAMGFAQHMTRLRQRVACKRGHDARYRRATAFSLFCLLFLLFSALFQFFFLFMLLVRFGLLLRGCFFFAPLLRFYFFARDPFRLFDRPF